MSVVREFDTPQTQHTAQLTEVRITDDDLTCDVTVKDTIEIKDDKVVDWPHVRGKLLTLRIKDLRKLFKQVKVTPTSKRKADLVDEIIVYFTTNVSALPVHLTATEATA